MADTTFANLPAISAIVGTEKIPLATDEHCTPAQLNTYIASLIGTVGTWTPSFGGFSTPPTVDQANYIKDGKRCTIHVAMSGSSVSNATTFTITLPFAAANTATQSFTLFLPVDNGSTLSVLGRLVTRVNSTTADLFTSVTSGTWTASGVKRASISITYMTT